MNAIAAVDRNWAIGREGGLLFHLPTDMKHFRDLTVGGTVILGRKTLETFPNGLPLKNRTNIVLTRNPEYKVKGAEVVHTVEEALELISEYPPEDVYVIGGDTIYRQFLPYCDVAHVTHIDHEYMADAWFPNLEEDPEWELTGESDEKTYFDLEFTFCKYERKK